MICPNPLSAAELIAASEFDLHMAERNLDHARKYIKHISLDDSGHSKRLYDIFVSAADIYIARAQDRIEQAIKLTGN